MGMVVVSQLPLLQSEEVRVGLYLGPLFSPHSWPEGWCLWYFRAAETSKGASLNDLLLLPRKQKLERCGAQGGPQDRAILWPAHSCPHCPLLLPWGCGPLAGLEMDVL